MLAVSFLLFLLVMMTGAMFVKKFEHLLSVFITLEFLSILIFVVMIYFFNFFFFLLTLFFLVISASESVLGLSLFVYFIRSSMKDYVYSLGILAF